MVFFGILMGIQSPSAQIATSGYEIYPILLIVIFIIARRIYKNIKGVKFSKRGVYALPAIYLALTIISFAVLIPTFKEIIIAALALVIGLFAGLHLGGGVKFFYKNKQAYYTRSPIILTIWLISYIIRIALDLLLPANIYLSIGASVLLAATTGMIIGEAHHINKAYKSYGAKQKPL